MKDLLKTNIGRLRILGFLEGTSLLVLVFIAMPLKYYLEAPGLTKTLGPIHGALFVLFIIYTVIVWAQRKWSFGITALIVLSCFIPFATLYVDKKYLSKFV